MGISHLVSLSWMTCCWLCSCNVTHLYFQSQLGLLCGKHICEGNTEGCNVKKSCKPVLLAIIESPFSTQSSSEKCWWSTQRLKHSVEIEFLTSHTIWAGTITKGQAEHNVFFSQLSSCCDRWKHFRTESVPSCSPDNVHATIPQGVIVDPASLRSERGWWEL